MAQTERNEHPPLHVVPDVETLRARLEVRPDRRARLLEMVGFGRREVVALAVLGALVVVGAGVAFVRSRPADAAAIAPVGAPIGSPSASTPATPALVVHVVGEVRDPGVYEFAEGARVVDAVRAAGWFTRRADTTAVNLARALADGEQIVVPRRGASGGSAAAAGSGGTGGGLVNINTATVADLDALPGIGPVLAERIIAYREQHGPFRTIQDLDKVSGIGPSTMQDLEPYITV